MRFLLTTLFFCALLISGFAQSEAGFVSLFNGKNLDGWEASTENPASFSVEDGTLIVKGGRSHLFYTGPIGNADFTDFELKLRVKTTPGSNSGVFFHTAYQKEGWPGRGFEAQVNSTQTDPRKTGSLYGVVDIWAPGPDAEPFVARVDEKGEVFIYQKQAPSTDGEWFDYHISVVDRIVTIRVNGMIQTQWTQPEDWSMGDRRLDHGTVAIQAHDPDSEVHYQDIRIKILD